VRSNTCVNCHNSGTLGQAPIFADATLDKAYDAITLSKKVDLLRPEDSRIVLKLAQEGHNCWSGSCADDSNTLLEAIKEWVKLAPPVSGNGSGIVTESKTVPNALAMAQTEHGTIILQAEQSNWTNDDADGRLLDGRFVEAQDSTAGAGKYLIFAEPEANPHGATRTFNLDAARFSSCAEFDDARDWQNPSNRALRVIQERTHNPSETIKSGSNTVNDGYLPRIASFQYNVVRPDKRKEYAQMLMSGNFDSVADVLLNNGNNLSDPSRAVGRPLLGLSGNPILDRVAVFSQS